MWWWGFGLHIHQVEIASQSESRRGGTLHSVYPTCHAMPRQSGHFCFCSALLRVFKARLQSDRCHSRCQIATHCFPWPVYSLAVLPVRCLFDVRQPINRCAINSPSYRGKMYNQSCVRGAFFPPSASILTTCMDCKVIDVNNVTVVRAPSLTQTLHGTYRIGGKNCLIMATKLPYVMRLCPPTGAWTRRTLPC